MSRLSCFFVLMFLPLVGFGEEESGSPWLVVPTISSNPKVGTAGGALAGYLHTFDPQSPASMFGAAFTYSTTDSLFVGGFARTYWDEDQKHLLAFFGGGKVNNDYDDFLGSGLPLSTTDQLKSTMLRYTQAVDANWYAGVQAIYSNYIIAGSDWFADQVLDLIGLTGYDSAALGLVLEYDTLDNPNSPSSGRRVNANNFAYRKSIGGEDSFDVYNLNYRQFWGHGKGHVFGLLVQARWTSDAPRAGYSSVSLRGYTRGQYLAPHQTTIEIEERYRIQGRLGAILYSGLTCLYGGGRGCDETENLYPTIGAGLQYVIQPQEAMVISTSFAVGKAGNTGFYMDFGQAF